MHSLRVCTQINLHSGSKENLSDYFRCGIEFCKNVGFDALDFPMKEISSLLGKTTDIEWKRCIERVKKDAEDFKIDFEVCHLPFTIWDRISHDDNLVAEFEHILLASVDAAKALGVKYAVMHPNTVPVLKGDYCEKKEFETVIKHLAPVANHAKKIGVSLAVENLGLYQANPALYRYCQSADEVCQVADTLGIGVCWDFGHANIGGYVQSEELKKIGSRLLVLHVNDNMGDADEHLPPFAGTINWEDAMSGLREIGFNGLLNYEIATADIPADKRIDFTNNLINVAKQLNLLYNERK